MTANNTAAGTARSPVKIHKYCDECAQSLIESADVTTTIIPGFGILHTECTDTCECGYLWPASLILTGEVIFYCGGCALAAGRDDLI